MASPQAMQHYKTMLEFFDINVKEDAAHQAAQSLWKHGKSVMACKSLMVALTVGDGDKLKLRKRCLAANKEIEECKLRVPAALKQKAELAIRLQT